MERCLVNIIWVNQPAVKGMHLLAGAQLPTPLSRSKLDFATICLQGREEKDPHRRFQALTQSLLALAGCNTSVDDLTRVTSGCDDEGRDHRPEQAKEEQSGRVQRRWRPLLSDQTRCEMSGSFLGNRC